LAAFAGDELEGCWATSLAVVSLMAGSGKTTEMMERSHVVAASGQFAFHAAVEDVGRDGLECALSSGSQAQLAAWRGTSDDAWFFIDSVDEAKQSGMRLERAARAVGAPKWLSAMHSDRGPARRRRAMRRCLILRQGDEPPETQGPLSLGIHVPERKGSCQGIASRAKTARP